MLTPRLNSENVNIAVKREVIVAMEKLFFSLIWGSFLLISVEGFNLWPPAFLDIGKRHKVTYRISDQSQSSFFAPIINPKNKWHSPVDDPYATLMQSTTSTTKEHTNFAVETSSMPSTTTWESIESKPFSWWFPLLTRRRRGLRSRFQRRIPLKGDSYPP